MLTLRTRASEFVYTILFNLFKTETEFELSQRSYGEIDRLFCSHIRRAIIL